MHVFVSVNVVEADSNHMRILNGKKFGQIGKNQVKKVSNAKLELVFMVWNLN